MKNGQPGGNVMLESFLASKRHMKTYRLRGSFLWELPGLVQGASSPAPVTPKNVSDSESSAGSVSRSAASWAFRRGSEHDKEARCQRL